MTKRLFTFGCSFTNSRWPTWADIVGREYDVYENWAQAGAGNSFIFYSLMECHKRNKLTQNDTVMIMWSSIGREDRYVRGEWITPGSIYNQTIYSEDFVTQLTDPTGYLLRDAAHLASAKSLLTSIGCPFWFFSIVPLNVPDDNIFKIFDIDNKILKVYAEEFNSVLPSVYEVVFDHNWYSRVGYRNLVRLEEEYNQLRGNAWPTWKEFTQQNFSNVSANIVDEINNIYEFSNRYLYRTDTHPLPAEHLEYLDRVASELVIDQETRNWVTDVTTAIVNHEDLKSLWKPNLKPKRF
jgi:hypothetical protein